MSSSRLTRYSVIQVVSHGGIVGRKIAATLTSTGTPANFLHPVEGMHDHAQSLPRSYRSRLMLYVSAAPHRGAAPDSYFLLVRLIAS